MHTEVRLPELQSIMGGRTPFSEQTADEIIGRLDLPNCQEITDDICVPIIDSGASKLVARAGRYLTQEKTLEFFRMRTSDISFDACGLLNFFESAKARKFARLEELRYVAIHELSTIPIPDIGLLSKSELKKVDRNALKQARERCVASILEIRGHADIKLHVLKCLTELNARFSSEKIAWYFQIEKLYFIHSELKRRKDPGANCEHAGGITDILRLLWRVMEEVTSGRNRAIREVLPDNSLFAEGGSLVNPDGLEAAYFSGHDMGHAFGIYERSNDDSEDDSHSSSALWEKFSRNVHKRLGVTLPHYCLRDVVFVIDRKIDFAFIPSPKFETVMAWGKRIELERMQAEIIRVLYERAVRCSNNAWMSSREIELQISKNTQTKVEVFRLDKTFRSDEAKKVRAHLIEENGAKDKKRYRLRPFDGAAE